MLFLSILDGRLMLLRYSKCSLTEAEPRKGRENSWPNVASRRLQRTNCRPFPTVVTSRITGQDCQDISNQSERSVVSRESLWLSSVSCIQQMLPETGGLVSVSTSKAWKLPG